MKNKNLSSSLTFQTFINTKYFDDLNGLRALSIIIVIYFHVTGAGVGLAHAGVNLFFVISGFLITTLLLREEDSTGGINLKFFYMRRVLRIFPIYYAVILLQVVLVLILNIPENIKLNFFDNLCSFLTFTQNWFVHKSSEHPVLFYHSWSLATEEQFYILWPAMLLIAKTWRNRIFVILGLLLFDYIMELCFQKNSNGYTYLYESMLTSLAAPICLGSIFALLCNKKPTFEFISRILGHDYIPIISLILFIFSLVIELKLVQHVALTCLVVSSCIQSHTLISRFLRIQIIRYIGSVSYGMYLMHMIAVNAVRSFVLPNNDPNGLNVFTVSLLLTLLISSLSYHLFEKHFLAIKTKFY